MQGYRDHLKHKTPTCEPCKKANTQYRKDLRNNKTKSNIKEFPKPLPTAENDGSKRILEHRENLAFVCNAMLEATPRELPSLSKRRQELSELIFELEKKETKNKNSNGFTSKLDEIRKRQAT